MATRPRPARLMPTPLLADVGPISAETQAMFAQSALISGAAPDNNDITALLTGKPNLFVNNLTNAVRR